MKLSVPVILLAASGALLSVPGCSGRHDLSGGCSDPECQAFYAKYTRIINEREAKVSRVAKEPTLRMRKNQLGGAAIRQNAWVHVLDNEGSYTIESASDYVQEHNLTVLGIDYDEFISIMSDWDNTEYLPVNGDLRNIITRRTGDASAKPAPSSAPERSDNGLNVLNREKVDMGRWERYCSGGLRMNEGDWKFVRERNYEVPQAYRNVCKRPDFTYDDYLEAWHKFCDVRHLTAKQQKIIKTTVRPKSLFDDKCRALRGDRSWKK